MAKALKASKDHYITEIREVKDGKAFVRYNTFTYVIVEEDFNILHPQVGGKIGFMTKIGCSDNEY